MAKSKEYEAQYKEERLRRAKIRKDLRKQTYKAKCTCETCGEVYNKVIPLSESVAVGEGGYEFTTINRDCWYCYDNGYGDI